MRTVKFASARTPTLLQVAVAAATVYFNRPYYHLFANQCYWFSDLLMQVLTITYLPDSDDCRITKDTEDEMYVPQGVDAGEFQRRIEKGSIIEFKGSRRGGTIMRVPVYWARKAVIKQVVEDYKRRLQEIEGGVCILKVFLCSDVHSLRVFRSRLHDFRECRRRNFRESGMSSFVGSRRRVEMERCNFVGSRRRADENRRSIESERHDLRERGMSIGSERRDLRERGMSNFVNGMYSFGGSRRNVNENERPSNSREVLCFCLISYLLILLID